MMWAAIGSAALAGPARAEERAKEPWLVDVEVNGVLPISSLHRRIFGLGAGGAVSGYRSLAPGVALGLKLRGLVVLDGDPPSVQGVEDPGLGTLYTGAAVVRVRPPITGIRRATGLWLEIAGGGGLTGDIFRPTFEAGVGYGIGLTDTTALAPTVRFIQVFQSRDALQPDPAYLFTFGVQLSLLDNRPDQPAGEPSELDRDGDGILDRDDRCVSEAEDKDGFKDEDGCPELDNDLDKILDADDRCPNMPEDFDEFEDDDGCPDEDNDEDGVLDPNDRCPEEPETLNGIDDEDGCPDEGLIEMRDDRIVLQERVLFDVARARVRSRGRPVLEAIVKLWKQHPEWTRVRIEGHSDLRGDPEFNQKLSERRAANVRRELIALGMDPNVVEAQGFGSTRPLSKGNSEQDHMMNRRVEFVVTARYGDLSDAEAQELGLVGEGAPRAGGAEEEAARGDGKDGEGAASPPQAAPTEPPPGAPTQGEEAGTSSPAPTPADGAPPAGPAEGAPVEGQPGAQQKTGGKAGEAKKKAPSPKKRRRGKKKRGARGERRGGAAGAAAGEKKKRPAKRRAATAGEPTSETQEVHP